MKVKIVMLITLFIAIILVPVIIYKIGNHYGTLDNIYEMIWDIDISFVDKQIYHKEDQHGFQGDGTRYTIYVSEGSGVLPFVISKDSTKQIQTINGNSVDGRDFTVEEFVQDAVSELSIPQNHRPVFDEYYEWQKLIKQDDTLIILYFPYNHYVYFIEKLI